MLKEGGQEEGSEGDEYKFPLIRQPRYRTARHTGDLRTIIPSSMCNVSATLRQVIIPIHTLHTNNYIPVRLTTRNTPSHRKSSAPFQHQTQPAHCLRTRLPEYQTNLQGAQHLEPRH